MRKDVKKEWFLDRYCGQQFAALLENGQLAEFSAEDEPRVACVGNIYKGRVANIVSGMNAAFIQCELHRNCYLSMEDSYTDYTKYDGTMSLMNTENHALKEGDEVLVSGDSHHSNIVPWQLACQAAGAVVRPIPVRENGELDMEAYRNMLSGRVKIVAVEHISNVLGIINPIKEVIDAAHALGIPVLVDGAQGIVHAKVDVQELDCDFYVFSGHKLYAATGTGVLYGKKELLDRMPPYMGGGEMVGTVTFAETTYAPLPMKFEAGTQNFASAATLKQAMDFINLLNDNELIEYYDKINVGFSNNSKYEKMGFLIKDVKSIKIESGVIEKLFGFANIEIEGEAGAASGFDTYRIPKRKYHFFYGVRNPDELYDELCKFFPDGVVKNNTSWR